MITKEDDRHYSVDFLVLSITFFRNSLALHKRYYLSRFTFYYFRCVRHVQFLILLTVQIYLYQCCHLYKHKNAFLLLTGTLHRQSFACGCRPLTNHQAAWRLSTSRAVLRLVNWRQIYAKDWPCRVPVTHIAVSMMPYADLPMPNINPLEYVPH